MEGGATLAQGRKPSGVSKNLYQDTANPTINAHCRSRSANLNQLGVEPEKGSQLHDTQRKTAGAPGKRQSSHTKRGSARAYPIPSRRRERRPLRRHRKKETPHTYTGTTRDGGPQLKHTRRATVGEREAEKDRRSKKGYTKSVT